MSSAAARGGGGVQRRIDRVYVLLRWVGALAQMKVAHLGVLDHQAVMVEFMPESLQVPPRARILTWMIQG